MKLFCTQRTRSMPMPYPQLVSFLLKKFRIDHLENGKKLDIEPFGKIQLNRMHIELPYDAAKGKIPKRNKEKQPAMSISQTQDEAQSTAPKSVHSQPSFMEATVQRQIHIEIAEMEARLNEARRTAEEQQERRYQELQKELSEVRYAVEDVRNLLLTYLHNLGPSVSEEDLRAHTSGTRLHTPSPPHTQPSPPHHSHPTIFETQLETLVSNIASEFPSSSTPVTTSPIITSDIIPSITTTELTSTLPVTSAIIPVSQTTPLQLPVFIPPISAIPSIFPPIPTSFPLPPLPLSYTIPAYALSHLFDADKKGEKDPEKDKDSTS